MQRFTTPSPRYRPQVFAWWVVVPPEVIRKLAGKKALICTRRFQPDRGLCGARRFLDQHIKLIRQV
jgi:hypothetical protein